MALERSARPLAQCLRCSRHERVVIAASLAARTFASSTIRPVEAQTQDAASSKAPIDPFTVVSPRAERKLFRETGQMPVGSRRRRAAMKATGNIPFEQLPYQCFQEARAILKEDRAEKLEAIRVERQRIEKLRDTVAVGEEAERKKEQRLYSMRQHLEELKLLADINDPMVKKTFEDGKGDMNKPIYRHLADKKWRSYERKIVLQRIEQMHLVPDILQKIDPIVSTKLSFSSPSQVPGGSSSRRRTVAHGEFVESQLSEYPPHMHIQPYTAGKQLVTIALINPDVPNVEKDGFDYRCHFLACNVPISATTTSVPFNSLKQDSQVIIDWHPAYAQKGAPYQRMAIIILAQPIEQRISAGSDELPTSRPMDVQGIKASGGSHATRDNFILQSFVDKYGLKPIGAHLFRTKWDEGTAGVMQRAGVPGWDVEFKRKRIDPLPYQRLKGERFR